VHVTHLAVFDFRNYERAELDPAEEGVTLLVGPNGAGKTNLLEALCYAASLRSFRGTPPPALVRAGHEQGFVSVSAKRGERFVQLEVELLVSGRGRLRLNRQAVRRPEAFVGSLLVTVFSPDDIALVKSGPQARRDYLDDLVVGLSPKLALVAANFERSLRQRNALLRSAGGFLRPGMEGVLDVWDLKVAEAGEALAIARESLVESLVPEVQAAYGHLGGGETVELSYQRSWEGGLLSAPGRAEAAASLTLDLNVTTFTLAWGASVPGPKLPKASKGASRWRYVSGVTRSCLVRRALAPCCFWTMCSLSWTKGAGPL
jgi:DNA replication and repair protein RecF